MTDHLFPLRQKLAILDRGSRPGDSGNFLLGLNSLDDHLGGGLSRGALHEIYSQHVADSAAATACGLAMAARAMISRAHQDQTIVWVRQDVLDGEAGEPYPPGLADHGIDPARLILVRAARGQDILRAANEAVRCRALGAVLIDLWGTPKALDLTASRRLSLGASQTGVTLILVRTNAQPVASAAASRWLVQTAPSIALEANTPGHPALVMTLMRHRSGSPPRSWLVEWNREQQIFTERASIPGDLVSFTGHRPATSPVAAPIGWRLTG